MGLSRLYSVKEAAEVLRVTPAAIRRWLYLRRLTFIKIGSRVLLEEAELQRLVEAGRQPAWPSRVRAVAGRPKGGRA